MAFLSLYRKYRPQSFKDLVGQKHVVKTLKNALEHNRIAHAYLFAGPRGTGKTSTAKIYAQSLNCIEGPTAEPCGKCEACQMIQSGQSIDVIEIDAASNRGIDEIRDLREKVKFYPSEGKYKVYIIDEVHMLTKGAFNALLKTLEEPPENVVFILATTEPHKVIDTIVSRCQRFDFSLLSLTDIIERLEYICKQEGVKYDKQSLNLIAAASKGGLRDAISLLDQGISFTKSNLNSTGIQEMLGKVDISFIRSFTENILNNNSAETLEMINEVINSGKGISMFVSDLLDFLRQVMLFKECGRDSRVFNFSDEIIKNIEDIATSVSTESLIQFLEILTDVERELSFAEQPRIVLELGVIKMSTSGGEGSLEGLEARIAQLEDKIREFSRGKVISGSIKKSTVESQEAGTRKQNIPVNDKGESGKGNPDNIDQDPDNIVQGNDDLQSGDKNEDSRGNNLEANNMSSYNVDEIRDVWPDILNNIKENSVSVQALLKEGKVVGVDGNKVIIQFPTDKTFHKKGAEQQAGLIQKVISQFLSYNCQLVFITEDEEYIAKKKEAEVEKVDNTAKKENIAASEDDVVSRVLKTFRGQVIKVNNEVLEDK